MYVRIDKELLEILLSYKEKKVRVFYLKHSKQMYAHACI